MGVMVDSLLWVMQGFLPSAVEKPEVPGVLNL